MSIAELFTLSEKRLMEKIPELSMEMVSLLQENIQMDRTIPSTHQSPNLKFFKKKYRENCTSFKEKNLLGHVYMFMEVPGTLPQVFSFWVEWFFN